MISSLVSRFIPGVQFLRELTPETILRDILSGLSVAAVAIPIGLAYAALMRLPVESGLYASVLPVIAYAFFGPSPRLIVGPDAATCTLIAAALTSLGLVDPVLRAEGAAALAIAGGLACFVAAYLRLGFVANFLSRPILTGYLTGVAITLFVSQLPKLTGIEIKTYGIFLPLVELAHKFATIHFFTFALGLVVLVGLRLAKSWIPGVPVAVIAVIAGILLSWLLNFSSHGIAVIGAVPEGMAGFHFPSFNYPFDAFITSALGIFVISFSSGIVTARSFAAKIGHSVDANRELRGFGVSHLIGGLFQGFTVTGADSRTAVSFATGGRTPLVAIVSAATIACVMMFLTAPLALLPQAVLGAILASASIDLVNIDQFRVLWRVSKTELVLALIATAGVIWLGVLPGVIVAVIATMGNLIRLAATPRDALLGNRPGETDIVKLHNDPQAQPIPGFVIYLFESPIVFFNADVFLRRSMMVAHATPDLRWFILDASVMTHADASTIEVLERLYEDLTLRGAQLAIAGGHRNFRQVLIRSNYIDKIGRDLLFDTPEQAVRLLSARQPEGV